MNIQKHLEDQIAAQKERLATFDHISLEDSEKANEFVQNIFKADDFKTAIELNGGHEVFAENCDKACKLNVMETIKMFENSLTLDLVEITTKYIITDETLTSPSGFSPSEKVFINNNIMIQTNRLPRSLSGGLSAYDASKF